MKFKMRILMPNENKGDGCNWYGKVVQEIKNANNK
jgi:hypothetical protein